MNFVTKTNCFSAFRQTKNLDARAQKCRSLKIGKRKLEIEEDSA